MKEIARGAEAVIHSDGKKVLKWRIEKKYRHPDIDQILRKARTRREAKVLGKLDDIDFPGPRLIEMCDKEMKIAMEHINGELLRDVLHKDHVKLSREIGKRVAQLHANDIIHGDLTTSNMIKEKEIKFIDFGLSFFSTKEEDKAVDLHLLKRALESKHHKIFEESFDEVLKGYRKHHPQPDLILDRLKKVEERGRNKGKH